MTPLLAALWGPLELVLAIGCVGVLLLALAAATVGWRA